MSKKDQKVEVYNIDPDVIKKLSAKKLAEFVAVFIDMQGILLTDQYPRFNDIKPFVKKISAAQREMLEKKAAQDAAQRQAQAKAQSDMMKKFQENKA